MAWTNPGSQIGLSVYVSLMMHSLIGMWDQNYQKGYHLNEIHASPGYFESCLPKRRNLWPLFWVFLHLFDSSKWFERLWKPYIPSWVFALLHETEITCGWGSNSYKLQITQKLKNIPIILSINMLKAHMTLYLLQSSLFYLFIYFFHFVFVFILVLKLF